MDEQRIMVRLSDEAWYSKLLVESFWEMSKLQMDILLVVMSGIKNMVKSQEYFEDKKDNYKIALEKSKNITFIVINANFNELRAYKNCNSAATRFEELDPSSRKFKPCIAAITKKDSNQQKKYRVFETCLYYDSVLKVKLNEEFIDALIADFDKDRFVAHVRVKDFLKMKREVSKKIYIMCCRFIGTNRRFVDTDWEEFLLRIGVKKQYSYSMIKSKFLEAAKEDINKMSDLIIDYEIKEYPVQGGKKPKSIIFNIHKKEGYANEENSLFL